MLPLLKTLIVIMVSGAVGPSLAVVSFERTEAGPTRPGSAVPTSRPGTWGIGRGSTGNPAARSPVAPGADDNRVYTK